MLLLIVIGMYMRREMYARHLFVLFFYKRVMQMQKEKTFIWCIKKILNFIEKVCHWKFIFSNF